MPGWYVHMQAAQDTAERLRAGRVPPGFPISVSEAKALGEVCHTWRNYLALGSLGPDLFYLLPDFSNTRGCVIRQVVKWALDVWEEIDSEFIGKWEKWMGPISTNASQLASQLTGGLSNQLAQVLDELTTAIMSAFKGLLAQMGDWFGVLTSGVPQAFGNEAFYWSDVFHYRRTYQFPFVLFKQASYARVHAATDEQRADADARLAFAVGWMTHCATDVTGHPFTNAKSGGPYRDHWQRHHLVENHMDSQNYSAINAGPCYGEYGTSALHFRLAFRSRSDAPYAGRSDGPAYDYFTGFPAYDTSEGPTPAAARAALFDLDSGGLPGHLTDALLAAMADVHPDGPKILAQDPPFSATDGIGDPDGRPNADAMAEMWSIAYAYLKMTGKGGLSPTMPQPPSVFTDHSFPTPPGGNYGVDDDPTRGADVDSNDSFNLIDLLLAIIAWAIYVAEVIAWLATVLPGLILDITTFPAREVNYYTIVVPAWNLYMLSRRALVMSGFLMPMPEEVDPGLTTLGSSMGFFSVASALDDPLAAGLPFTLITEPSGRENASTAFGLDQAYPRNIVRDDPADVTASDLVSALELTTNLRYANDGGVEYKPSEWVAPWRYPLKNQAGQWVAQEGAPAHVGPYVSGQSSTVLLSAVAGDDSARKKLEACTTPQDTYAALDALLPLDAHLGGPMDYSTYLVGRMVGERALPEFTVPDFNLDSDRGYAWHCWDWDRHNLGRDSAAPGDPGVFECVPDFTAVTLPSLKRIDFSYPQPCTPPQFFKAGHDNPRRAPFRTPLEDQWYQPRTDLRVHYLSRAVAPPPEHFGDDPCGSASKPVDLNLGTEWPGGPLGGGG